VCKKLAHQNVTSGFFGSDARFGLWETKDVCVRWVVAMKGMFWATAKGQAMATFPSHYVLTFGFMLGRGAE
jgi:hypothetical protein